MKRIFKVVAQKELIQVKKTDGTLFNKCQIVLQEFGGQFENSYVCWLKDNAALCHFNPGDVVLAALSFKHSEYQGKLYNDITVQDIMAFVN